MSATRNSRHARKTLDDLSWKFFKRSSLSYEDVIAGISLVTILDFLYDYGDKTIADIKAGIGDRVVNTVSALSMIGSNSSMRRIDLILAAATIQTNLRYILGADWKISRLHAGYRFVGLMQRDTEILPLTNEELAVPRRFDNIVELWVSRDKNHVTICTSGRTILTGRVDADRDTHTAEAFRRADLSASWCVAA